MKRNSLIAALAVALMASTSCTTAALGTQTATPTPTPTTTTTTTPANDDKGGLGGLLGGLGNLGGGDIGGIVDVISNALGITTTDIVGTWVYEEPAVLFESDNFLTSAGGKIAAETLKKKLDGYYKKVGITKGKMTMTFDADGNFTQSLAGKQVSGTYTVENGQVKLVYGGGVKQFVGTTQFDGNNLVIVVDASKLLSFAQTLSSITNNATLNSVSSLLSGFDGLKAGLEFKKQR